MEKYDDDVNRQERMKFVMIQHLHAVEGSVMGGKYKCEPFKLFTLDEYANFLCELLPLVRPDVVVQRLFVLSDRELFIAPNWQLKKSEIQYYIDQKIINNGIIQGSALL